MFISKHNFVWTSKQFRARVYLHSRDWAEWIVKITGWLGICRQKLRLSSSFKSETRLCCALKLMRRGKSLTFASSLRHLRTICFLFSRFCYSKEKSRIRSRFACFCAKDSIKFPLKPKNWLRWKPFAMEKRFLHPTSASDKMWGMTWTGGGRFSWKTGI